MFTVPKRARRGCWIFSGVIDNCELWYGFWELNLSPLEEQLVLLTAEPSLQPKGFNCFCFVFLVSETGFLCVALAVLELTL